MLQKRSSILPVITCATILLRQGLLGSVELLMLGDVDLTSVSTEDLASLVSSVMGCVIICNVSGCDLVTILDHVNSEWLYITRQSLASEETRALVRAMGSRVARVRLNVGVTLDIRALTRYDGQGQSGEVGCYLDTARRYRDQMGRWATTRNWAVTRDDEQGFHIERM